MILLLLFSFLANATVVNLTRGEQKQTVDAQTFTFNFDSSEVPISDGNDGLLFFNARGDYSLDKTNENITITIDGIPLGPYSASDGNLIHSYNEEDNEWEMSTAIPGSFISLWTEDQQIEMIVSLSSDVNIGLAAHEPKDDYNFDPYVDVTLQYTVVPIPMSLWLFASSFISLLVVRRS